MVFTERQKNELHTIVKEISQKIVNQIITDKDFMDALAVKVADVVSKKMDEKIKILETKINTLENELKSVQGEKEELYLKIDDLEQVSKLNQLRLYGVPEDKNDLKLKVIQIFENKLGISGIELEHCYRIGKQQPGKARPIIIKFAARMQRNIVFFNKKKLKGSKFVIVEELTLNRYQLLMLARDKMDKNNVWTADGRVFVKINGKKTVLKTPDDVLKYSNA